LVLEHAIERLRVARVLYGGVAASLAFADREAVAAIVGLGPPAVGHGEVQSAIEERFLSARPAGLERTPRGVEPHVAALHEAPRGRRDGVRRSSASAA